MSADLHLDLFAVDDDTLRLKVWFKHLLGVSLRVADIVAKLLAFTGDVTFVCHYILTFVIG